MTRRDKCYLVGKRASLLTPDEACTAWQIFSLKVQAMEEMDIPKFRDLIAAVRTSTIISKQHTIKTAAHIHSSFNKLDHAAGITGQ